MKGKEIVRTLMKEGWTIKRTTGSHFILYKEGAGIVPIPCHNKDLKIGTLKSISKQAGIKLPSTDKGGKNVY
jgi:predicted RNA binding protein YcfA (HicA-like mRNA interferase family)